jgi:hypothetical protein
MSSTYATEKEYMRRYIDTALRYMRITPVAEAHLEYTSTPGSSIYAPMLLYVDGVAVRDGEQYAIFNEWGVRV